ncbi:TPR repeat region-containing protein [Mycolicibacterium neworleansense]|uniref:Putative alanine and glycine rich protein n=1 Tax=Mycolicibacterium neworleansense TaxID=146018 RepID=A0A0H5RVA6_9MYCO|nr:EspA/EspE family type VII secretion system effector [Mycolicibacterium neworleansense]MCV7360544.1 hypothetical protein [Mycolicibacterium neworleansense]CRZ17838.1 putative alanine and glycine rich protein [Mycolicibacterium neworleansense]
MGVLDGFYSTWNKAKDTFGVGTPTDGSQYNGSSSQLLKMKSSIESAQPDDRWQGKGSEAYAAANKEHAGVYEKLADLDKKMAAEVTNAANVVTNGRNQLDTTKSWVDSAVNALPSSLSAQAREKSLIPIANQGITQVNNTVENANKDMNTIAGRFTGLRGEFDALTNQKFAPGEKKGDAEGLTDKDGDGKPDEEDVHKRAEQDVQDALSGNKEAAARVDEALTGITPGQKLTETQGAYLSQMQAQQKGMSLERLEEVHKKLGEHGDILPNSWQLMSNKDVEFPTTATKPEALDDPNNLTRGGSEKLPNSVIDPLQTSGTSYTEHAQAIANIVDTGDKSLQRGTELDRALLNKADAIMDTPPWEKDRASQGEDFGRDPFFDPAVSDIFAAVDDDHEVVRDHLVGGKGQDFLHDINNHAWSDKGTAAGALFEWTKDTTGPDSKIAAETAEVYGKYLGVYGEKLLDLPGHESLGDRNPNLVQSFAHGLAPYQEAMVGEKNVNGFDPLDSLGTNMTNTRNLFAVLDSDPDAAKYFNSEAYKSVKDYQDAFADAAKSDPSVPGSNPHHGDLAKAGRLLGLIDAGAYIETANHNENIQQSAYDHAKDAWDIKKAGWDVVGENIPVVDRLHAALEQGMIGPEPVESDFPEGTTSTNVGVHNDDRQLGNGATHAAYSIAAGLVHGPNNDIVAQYFNGDALMTPAEVRARYGESGWEDYRSQLSRYFANTHPSLGFAISDFQSQYTAPNTNLPERED